MLSPRIFNIMENLEPKFPIIDFYLSNVRNQIIKGYTPTDFKMMDVGKLNVLEEAERFLIND
jgi:uncharacterized protein with HEPN domain